MLGPAPFEQTGKKKSSSESPEASGLIGGLTPEKSQEIRNSIAEKSKLANGLRKTGQEKFEEFKALKKAVEDEQATMLRLKIAGKLNLSEDDMTQAKRDGLEKLEAAGRDAENYRNDAEELEREIEAMNAELGEQGN